MSTKTGESAPGAMPRPSVAPPALKAWVPPTFERLSLTDALAGVRGVGRDIGCS